MAEALTTQEHLAVEEFLSELRCREEPHCAGLISQATAVKFLMARKFDVSRAVDLLQAYKNTRIKEGIININPDEEPLRSELLSGKFTILPGRDANGAALALFTARLHRPDVTTHKAVLQVIIYQLDKAIDSVQTQRDGLLFIYDMTDSGYGNFDYDLCVKILNLLKVCTVKAHKLANHIPVSSLPEHLGGTSRYSHVAWIQSCINASTVEGDAQIRDTHDCVGSLLRSYSLECGDPSDGHLSTRPDPEPSPASSNFYDDCDASPHNHGYADEGRTLGHSQLSPRCGPNTLQGNHRHWSDSAGSPNSNMNGRRRPIPPRSDTPPGTPLPHEGDGDAADGGTTDSRGGPPSEQMKEAGEEGVPPLPQKSSPRPPQQPASQTSPLSSPRGPDDEDRRNEESVHVPEQGGMAMQELLDHVKRNKKKGIYQEYEEIRKEPPAGTFDYSKKLSNQLKNRYSDVLCLDQSRVRLCRLCDDGDETSDYINASFMDGYKRRNAYIAAQGPLPKTFGDFWRMVWEQMVLIVVMTTRVVERGRVKCGQYWPLEEGRTEQHGCFLVRNTHIQVFDDFKLSHLELCNTQSGEKRDVCHYLYVSWPDFGVPKSASAMLDFREHVLQRQDLAVRSLGSGWKGPPGGPPLVVHCSAGIGRTGTFCTLDICLSRLEDVGTVDVQQTVRRMRTQRAFSIQTWEQYYFCYTAVIEYAVRRGKLGPVQWSDSEIETDSE
ncbi:tyrosine-protein phosphatase non-receptor type 9 isoform X2 [Syngnathoides biaculeatus]|uniref:tyrosine-protein phosphatase non-receptor type 9 isoform X2 n=1 Tax=Syngnathoides biaculeatus TaxID=300417 RepID=UPI002ADE81C8|nr:tyrosine-protein phosphatase non-receptor type 9 isoform X2 [Syngnathoides biaculeatus]